MKLNEASVLIVDDEPILRLTFSILLKQQGATVHSAADGAEALNVLAREHVDVMLTDKQMPHMDGMALLRALHAERRSLPSILFVNGVQAESAAEMHRLGVMETVTKPLHPDKLVSMLGRVLQGLPVVR